MRLYRKFKTNADNAETVGAHIQFANWKYCMDQALIEDNLSFDPIIRSDGMHVTYENIMNAT